MIILKMGLRIFLILLLRIERITIGNEQRFLEAYNGYVVKNNLGEYVFLSTFWGEMCTLPRIE